MTIEPLHIATVGGLPLRFFKTPLNDGRPDLAWHAVDDLHRCLGLNREGRKIFLRKLRSKVWGAIVRSITTADGVITAASSEALKKINIPFAFPSDAFFDWMKAAMNRWEPPKPAP
jgi:hypothetical protein